MTRKKIKTIQEALDRVPEAIDTLGDVAENILRLKRIYVDRHWGDEGSRGMSLANLPDPSEGLIEMGRFVEVAYETVKGRGRSSEIFVHRFRKPYPILAFAAADAGLVVVRDRSLYTVTSRGIEG